MAVYSGFHVFVPTIRFNRASVFAASQGIHRRSSLFAIAAWRVLVAAGEVILFLWMVTALACLLPIVITI